MTRQLGKEKVSVLIKNFESDKKVYKSANFQEAEARKFFIDPFFSALGWKYNIDGVPKSFWDVHLEPRQRVGSTTKKPDYVFRIKEGNKFLSKFFVEAKAPHVNLDTKEPVFQAKRYAFSSHGKTPIVILTDFETFRVFNGLEKPIFDNPNRGLLNDLEYNNYLDNWDNIWDDFSKEAVTSGSIEKLIGKEVHNVKSLDDEFLADISAWRVDLAKNIANRNKGLSVDDINEAVQRILDRLIFVRNLEDRGIETDDTLKEILKKKDYKYTGLLPFLRKLDADYNGLLFKDHFSEKITIDEHVIKDIVNKLYEPYSPYSFDIIEPEILGRIYERFLGSKIRLTESHLAKVEEKPEVKKAGGVYYTPQYIVDYIVENTVGVKIKDKSPEEIAKIKICDPACGSGSFLLGAFQYLLEYHREWYAKENQTAQKKYQDDFFMTAENEIQLSLRKKTEILKNNIFGVDIDREATEVAIMSLYLKVLDEGYDKGNIEMFMKGILPDMMDNIKCGNSLIGTDYSIQGELIQTEELKKVNCFDWAGDDGFSDIFKNGGFDVVIGNPPYVKEYTERSIFEDIKKSYMSKYYEGKMDLWYFFVCLGIDKLKDKGVLGFIAPNNWITNSGASILRNKILKETIIRKYFDFSDFMVFRDASIQTMVFILEKEKSFKPYNFLYNKLINKNILANELSMILLKNQNNDKIQSFNVTINFELMQNKLITFNNSSLSGILEKIYSSGKYFLTNKNVAQGIVCPQDFVIDKHLEILKNDKIKKGDGIFIINDKEKKLLKLSKNEQSIIKPYYTTNELQRFYGNPNNSLWVIYSDINVRKNIKNYPNIKAHLDSFKKIITSDFAPYGLHRAREQSFFEGTKIISLRKTQKPYFTYTEFSCYVSQTYFVIKPDDINLKYLTSILNSRLMYFWLYNKGKKQGELLQVDKEPLLDIPIVNTTDKIKHDALINLVDKIIDFKQKEAMEVSDHQKSIINRQITAFEKEIDKIVYELYNLTTEEIKIVES